MSKDLRDLKAQKDWLVKGLSDVPLDSIEYEQMLKQYKTVVETEEMIKKGKSERSPFNVVYKVLMIGVSVLGAVFVPLKLGSMAYDNEKEMSLKNATVWNLIPKGKLPDVKDIFKS